MSLTLRETLAVEVIEARSGDSTWAKGSSVVEVMKDARLSMEHTLWNTTDLWHTLVKDKKAWLTQDDIAKIDCDCARDPWAWPAALERKRWRRT